MKLYQQLEHLINEKTIIHTDLLSVTDHSTVTITGDILFVTVPKGGLWSRLVWLFTGKIRKKDYEVKV